MRACLISRAAARYPSLDRRASAANVALTAVDGFQGLNINVYWTAINAASAVGDGGKEGDIRAATMAMMTATDITMSANVTHDVVARIWSAVVDDAQSFLSGVIGQDLATLPLWKDRAPTFLRDWRISMRKVLCDFEFGPFAEKDWSIWDDWYSSIEIGGEEFGLTQNLAHEIVGKIALIDGYEERWQMPQSEVNRTIASWLSEARVAAGLIPPPPHPSLQFSFVDGLVRLWRGLGLGSEVDDQKRIQDQLPILRQLVCRLKTRLEGNEIPQTDLIDALSRLHSILDRRDPEQVGVTELFSYTLVFRDQLAAATKLPNGNVYELPEEDKASAKSIVTVSDLIVLATDEGRKLFDDAEHSDLDAGEFEKLRDLEMELLDRIGESGHVMDPDELALIKAVLVAGNRGPVPKRAMHLAAGSMRNLVIVMTGVGFVGSVASAAAAIPTGVVFLAGLVFGGALKPVGTMINESIKKSQAGKVLSDALAEIIDKKTIEAIVKNKELLRRIAKDRRGFEVVEDMIAWAEKHTPPKN